MVEDLNMTGIQYNIALSIFFIPYILLEGLSIAPQSFKEAVRAYYLESAANNLEDQQSRPTSSSRNSNGPQHTSASSSSRGAS